MNLTNDSSVVSTAPLERLHAPLAAFVRKRVLNQMDADDVLQDILLRVHRRAGTVRDPQRLTAWAFRIARNVLIDVARATARRTPTVALEALGEAAAPLEASQELGTAAAAIATSLPRLLAEMPPEYRQALSLTEFGGLSQRQLAKRLGLSVSGAKSRVQRARALLRQAVLACCHLDFDVYGRIIDYQPRHACPTCSRSREII